MKVIDICWWWLKRGTRGEHPKGYKAYQVCLFANGAVVVCTEVCAHDNHCFCILCSAVR
jgi:hypothetical protein